MFAVGHCALGYLIGRGTSKLQNHPLNLPLLLAISVLPDLDFLLPVRHRGPSHSLVVLLGIAIPFVLVYRRRSLPYVLMGLQHDLSDTLTGGVQLLWPFNREWYALYNVTVLHVYSVIMEITLFVFSIGVFIALQDYRTFLAAHLKNAVLLLPGAFLAAPLLVRTNYPFPSILVVPSITYLLLFLIAVVNSLTAVVTTNNTSQSPS